MNHEQYINSRAKDYKEYLLHDLRTNVEFANVVDLIFFPSHSNIREWLEWTKVKSFHEYEYRGDPYVNRICTRDEIDNIPPLRILNNISPHTIFSCLKYGTYEEAAKVFPTFYHFMKKDFDRKIDKLILDRLPDFKKESGHIYKKTTLDDIDFTLNIEREHIELSGIIGYTLPALSIYIKGEECITFGTIDVRSLLFLPESSFMFFYVDSQDISIDPNVARKNDEPVIYYLEDEQKYMVTNSWENLKRYNSYIQIILELSFHYFRAFEKWLMQIVNEIH